MYFQTRTINVIDKCIDIVAAFNSETGLDVALKLNNEQAACGSLNCNLVNDVIKDVSLNPNIHENIEGNRVYIYIVLHELGHALDIVNYHADVRSYFGNYRKNQFQYEVRAWEIGIQWGIQNGYISPVNFPNLKKFMEYCLESYSKGNLDIKGIATTVLANTQGGK
jgi:hypothetical protein